MELMKLSELCHLVGVSRRCIQGYESYGLISPSDKNKYGHLLYDQAAVERAKMIHFMQEVGFALKEIVELIDASDDVLREAFRRRLPELEMEEERLRGVIERVKEIVGEE